MIRVLLAPVMLGLVVLACGRDRAGDAAMNRDTLAAPVGTTGAVADTSAAVAPAPAAGDSAQANADTNANAPKPQAANAPAPAANAPTVPSSTKPAVTDTPPSRPNINPHPAQPSPTVPRSAVTPSDTPPAPLRDPYHQAPKDTVSQTVYNGWKQFNLNCARCHGEDVLGTTIAPHLILSLKPDGPINTKELFIQTVCNGRPEKGMPAWCSLGLDTAKIEQIYSYVKGRSDAKIGPGRPAVRP